MKTFSLFLDVIDRCNLKCPSCPQSHAMLNGVPRKLLTVELLDRILKKAVSEFHINHVFLYNWAEPFLHPDLPELIRLVKSYNLVVFISSNLNVRRNFEEVMAARPDNFVISVSGFTQPIYERTHKGGNIERVKAHMRELSEINARLGNHTRLEVNFIRYVDNLDEMMTMHAYAASLGIAFRQTIAALFPLEKLLKYLSEPDFASRMSADEKRLLDILIFPYEELIRVSPMFKSLSCPYRGEEMVINSSGVVQLCPLAFDPELISIVPYLDHPLDEIQRRKDIHPLCKVCGEYGIYTLGFRFGPNLKPSVVRKVAAHYAKAGVSFGFAHEKPRREALEQWIRLGKEKARRSSTVQSLCQAATTAAPGLGLRLSRYLGLD